MKKQSSSLIAKLLNKNSQPKTAKTGQGAIILRDARTLVPNPKNKAYSMDNIEELAAMIELTHHIDTILIRELPDGHFMVISGHRRRLAQIYRYEHGMADTADVPTMLQPIINDFSEAKITDDEMETLNVVFPNKGSRRNMKPSEEAAEIAMIKPIIYKLYEYQKAAGTINGKFRPFFAEILGISQTSLLRKESINKLSNEVKAAVDDGTIPSTAAAELSNLRKEEQTAVVSALQQNGGKVTVKAVADAKEKINDKKTVTVLPAIVDAGKASDTAAKSNKPLAPREAAASVKENPSSEQIQLLVHVKGIMEYCREQHIVDAKPCKECQLVSTLQQLCRLQTAILPPCKRLSISVPGEPVLPKQTGR